MTTTPSRGQATVELALGLPVVLVGVLLVLQLALVGRDAVLVTHSAREGARTAATEPVRHAAWRGASESSSALDPERLEVSLRRERGRVAVTVEYRSRTALPIVGAFLPDPTLHGAATMLEEPDLPAEPTRD